MVSRNPQFGKSGDCALGELDIGGIEFNPNAVVPDGDSGSQCRPGTGKRVEHYALSQGEYCPHKLSQEALWLQARMRR